MSGNRELSDSFEAAVDQAMAAVGQSTDDAEASEEGPAREASEPAKAHIRAVAHADDPDAAEPNDLVADQVSERVEREERDRGPARAAAEQARIERLKKYEDFVDDVDRNPALRKHILAFWEQNAQTPPQDQPEDDPLADYDEKDRIALGRLLAQQEKRLRTEFERELAPLKEQLHQSHAEREFAELSKQYPDWDQWVSRKDLAEVRQQLPQLSLLAAYKLVGFDKVRAKVSKADRNLATVRDAINRKHPAESQSRRHVKVDRREMAYDEAFDKAYAQARAAFGAPGR